MKIAILLTTLNFIVSLVIGQVNFLEKGNSFLNAGNFESAEKTFREGLKINPDDLVLQCQLGLTLIQKGKYTDAEVILTNVLEKEPDNVGAHWYSGVGNYQNAKSRKAIEHFEAILPKLDTTSGQYFAAHWFIGKSYSNLLRTEGLTYSETSRMFECFEEYLRLQPNAKDSKEIREYVDRKKKRRPGENVKKWIDM